MLIRNFGLFWRADQVVWSPGKGKKGAFRLLGRRGKNLPGLRVCDFRGQQGIYILYGDYGPYYVGLTKKQGLGKRLKDHLSDEHKGLWDRFSWFGFRSVLKGTEADGTRRLRKMAEGVYTDPNALITDLEALLIKAMGLSNKADMNFSSASGWTQVQKHEVASYLKKVAL